MKMMVKMKVFYPVVVLLAVLVIMFSGVARAGEVPDGFVGVPWGASTAQIIKTMNERGYQRLDDAGPDSLRFEGVFAGYPCDLSFSMKANSFYSGWADFGGGSAAVIQFKNRSLVAALSKKYGPPTSIVNGENDALRQLIAWDFVDIRTSDKYIIHIMLMQNQSGDTSIYWLDLKYKATSLGERLEKKEY